LTTEELEIAGSDEADDYPDLVEHLIACPDCLSLVSQIVAAPDPDTVSVELFEAAAEELSLEAAERLEWPVKASSPLLQVSTQEVESYDESLPFLSETLHGGKGPSFGSRALWPNDEKTG
jgi:hypothetical protein